MNKKGQSLSGLYQAVLIIVLVGISIGIGVIILSQLATNVDSQGQTTVRVNNETVTGVGNKTSSTYSGSKVLNIDRGVTIIQFTNATKEWNIEAANFTILDSGIFIVSNGTASNMAWNGTAVNVTYTYQKSGTAFRAVNSTMSAVGNFTDWLPIIVLVIVAALILGLIIRNFIGRQE